jgi:hypothetical protein
VVGIATEPPTLKGSSEDLIVVDAPEWTPEFLINLEEQKRHLEIVQPGNYKEYAIHGDEFPEIPRRSSDEHPTNLNCRQRRTEEAKARLQKRKQK